MEWEQAIKERAKKPFQVLPFQNGSQTTRPWSSNANQLHLNLTLLARVIGI